MEAGDAVNLLPVIAAAAGMLYLLRPAPAAVVRAPAAPVVASSAYRYDAPPSISRATYAAIYCEAGSAACDEAGAMYDTLVAAGLDPAIQAGQATHETSLGTAGVGAPPTRNLHGVQCHAGDNRIGDSAVGWGNGCAGVYASYTASVETWARLIHREYLSEGRNTPQLVVAKYAPAGADGNSPPAYIASMEAAIDGYRAREAQAQPSGVASSPLSLAGDCGHNVRVALDASGGALRRVTIPPGATWSFNATMGNPAAIPYVSYAGVPGGCWCDLAARYAVVGAQLGLVPTFEHHGIALAGVPYEYSVAIWNTGGGAGSAGPAQDLELTNTTGRTIVLTAREDGGMVTIEGGVS